MRIAVVLPPMLPLPAVCGGAVEMLTEQCLRANEPSGRHSITVYCPWAPGAEEAARGFRHTRFEYIRTGILPYRAACYIYNMCAPAGYYNHYEEYWLTRVLRRMRRQAFDLIVAENRPGYAPRLAATGAKVVCHLHNDYISADIPQSAAAAATCDKIICVSDFLRRRVETTACGTPAATVHNGIDLATFQSAKPADRASYGLRDSDFIVVFSGRLIADKGISELIEAIRLLKEYEDIRLMVVGAGGESYSSVLHQSAVPLAGKVVFTGGVPHSALPALLRMADIAAVPSVWQEPFGLVSAEAIAAGLPVVATRTGATAEVLDDSCSLLIAADEGLPRHLAAAILRLHDDPELRRRMAAAAAARAPQFSTARFVERWWQEIDDMA